jgi:hypothetical protein
MKNLEKIFTVSNSQEELFDAFITAIRSKIDDPEFYKPLLSNNALSADEISMYAEKICHDFPHISYPISCWAGKVFESLSTFNQYHDKAFEFYKKAAEVNDKNPDPYISIIKLYNKEYDTPELFKVTGTALEGIIKSPIKSKICFELSKLYKAIGEEKKVKEFQSLGEKFQKSGC